MQYKSIRTRLAFTTLLVLVFSLLGSLWIANKAFSTTLHESTYSELAAKSHYLSTLIDPSDAEPWITHNFESYAQSTETRITVIDKTGKVLFDSDYDPATMTNHLYREEVQAALTNTSGEASSERKSTTQNLPVIYWARHIENHPDILILRVSKTLNQLGEYQDIYQGLFFRGLAVLLILFAFITFLLVTTITRPLDQLKGLAKRYAKAEFGARLHLESPSELAELGNTMEEMAKQIRLKMDEVEFSRNQVEAILNSLTEGILMLDKGLTIRVINRQAELLFAQGENIIGKNLSQVINSNEIRALCNTTLQDGQNHEVSVQQFGHLFGQTAKIAGRGQARELKILSGPVLGVDHAINAVVISINDMTELKRLEQIRKDFVANVSHELKTPITSIAGFSEAISETHDEKELAHFAQIINRQANRMKQLVEDLLLLSSLEQEESKATMNWTTIDQIISETEEGCLYRFEDKGSKLTINSDNPENFMLFVNEHLITQALTNLVINALNYSEAGKEVILSCKVTENEVELKVKDQGIGIPKDVQGRIFERFYRVDTARSRSQGGTGLGLSIVKHIVNVHGGIIAIDSTPGIGSCFTITLPRMGGMLTDLHKRSEQLYSS